MHLERLVQKTQNHILIPAPYTCAYQDGTPFGIACSGNPIKKQFIINKVWNYKKQKNELTIPAYLKR